MDLPAAMRDFDWSLIQGVPEWFLQVLVVLALTYCASLFLKKIHQRLSGGLGADSSLWVRATVVAGYKPANLVIWVLGLSVALDIVGQINGSPLLTKLNRFGDVFLIAVLVWGLLRVIRKVEQYYLEYPTPLSKRIDETTAVALGRLLRVSVLVIGLLIIMQSMGFSISGLLAFGGVSGLAIGFAAKDMLANFFGGLMIYLDKPFGVGDWVSSPDRQIEGTVQYIGWRQTRILTFEKRPLYVPNSTFMNISVENPSRMQNRRIKETIGLRYSDGCKVAPILQAVRDYLNSSDVIDTNQIVMVNFNTFGASSLDFFIYCFTKTTDWAQYHMEKEKVLLDIMQIIHQHGADIAFPTQTLDFPEEVMPEKFIIKEKLGVEF